MLVTISSPKIIWEEHVAVPIGYNGTPHIHIYLQNCPFPFDNNHLHLIHPSLDRPHSPSQTASGSSQPFCHSTLAEQTDRQMVSASGLHQQRLRCIDSERRANYVATVMRVKPAYL